jgi:hypothetical protein
MTNNERLGLHVHKASEMVCFPWTRVRRGVRLASSGELVDVYELGPLTREHVGPGGVLSTDVGRRLVRHYALSNKNWTMVSYIVDEEAGKSSQAEIGGSARRHETSHAESITLEEALHRVHLEGLWDEAVHADVWVEWTGYPVPFSCGHYRVEGFGPRRGDGRRESELRARVSQEHSGVGSNVLFRWSLLSSTAQHFHLRGQVSVNVAQTEDGRDVVLVVGLST